MKLKIDITQEFHEMEIIMESNLKFPISKLFKKGTSEYEDAVETYLAKKVIKKYEEEEDGYFELSKISIENKSIIKFIIEEGVIVDYSYHVYKIVPLDLNEVIFDEELTSDDYDIPKYFHIENRILKHLLNKHKNIVSINQILDAKGNDVRDKCVFNKLDAFIKSQIRKKKLIKINGSK